MQPAGRWAQGRASAITRVTLKPGGHTRLKSTLRLDLRRLLPPLPGDTPVEQEAEEAGCVGVGCDGLEIARIQSLGQRYADVFFACKAAGAVAPVSDGGGESCVRTRDAEPPAPGSSTVFACHRCILGARSEYFAAMLRGPWATVFFIGDEEGGAGGGGGGDGSQRLVIPIEMQPWLFHAVLEFVYADAVPKVFRSTVELHELREQSAVRETRAV
eukprot:COSAG01_NODE_6145_length_3825_cov_7.907944_5_plen_215_part_00